jgi:hypothetical protein
MNYKKRGEDYEFVIDQAFTRIEEPANVQLLRGGNATQGTIFLLKNHHHYADKVEQTHVHEAGDSLTQLVQSLQGRVLRPQLQHHEPEVIEDAEYTEMDMDDLI